MPLPAHRDVTSASNGSTTSIYYYCHNKNKIKTIGERTGIRQHSLSACLFMSNSEPLHTVVGVLLSVVLRMYHNKFTVVTTKTTPQRLERAGIRQNSFSACLCLLVSRRPPLYDCRCQVVAVNKNTATQSVYNNCLRFPTNNVQVAAVPTFAVQRVHSR